MHLPRKRLDMKELAVEGRVNGQNPFGQWRMGGLKVEQRIEGRIDKVQMTRGFRVRRVEPASFVKSADFFKRARDARRVARELHRRRVSQPFTLAANQTLDQAHERRTDASDDQ